MCNGVLLTHIFLRVNRAVVLQKAQRIPEALGAFKKGVEVDPENSEVHNAIGVLLVELGQIEKAAECFRKASVLACVAFGE
jgi:Tfp pilus assembly protein PilF